MQVLPYHIGIGKFFRVDEKVLFLPVRGLEKNKRFPAVGVENGLKTTNVITPGKKTDIIRIPIYQGDHNAKGTNPVLNNLVNEVIITGETIPSLLPEGSDVDITIKIDSSQIMQFSAYFPLIDHTEELKIEIKQTKLPTEEFLAKEISKSKWTAKNIKASDIFAELEDLEIQFNNERGSADGKMRILDNLRKQLLKLDIVEKSTEWPKVEEELKQVFYELEDLIEKIIDSSSDGDLNMDMINAQVEEFRRKTEQILTEKNLNDGKALIKNIGQIDFELRNAASGNAMDVEFLYNFNSNFNSFHWKNPTKARQLLNQGMAMAAAGNTSSIRPVLIQLVSLLPEGEKPTAGELE
jgi:molecular chaperone DnaK